MEIKTKFAIGDKVWTIKNCKAAEFEVEAITLFGTVIFYGSDRYEMIDEAICFATKEELIKYIFDDGNESA